MSERHTTAPESHRAACWAHVEPPQWRARRLQHPCWPGSGAARSAAADPDSRQRVESDRNRASLSTRSRLHGRADTLPVTSTASHPKPLAKRLQHAPSARSGEQRSQLVAIVTHAPGRSAHCSRWHNCWSANEGVPLRLRRQALVDGPAAGASAKVARVRASEAQLQTVVPAHTPAMGVSMAKSDIRCCMATCLIVYAICATSDRAAPMPIRVV